jgi:hypothetical protein
MCDHRRSSTARSGAVQPHLTRRRRIHRTDPLSEERAAAPVLPSRPANSSPRNVTVRECGSAEICDVGHGCRRPHSTCATMLLSALDHRCVTVFTAPASSNVIMKECSSTPETPSITNADATPGTGRVTRRTT